MKKSSRIRDLRSSPRGQSLVEFAMVLPLLLVVAFMITEFGRALWIKNALTGAAGSAARAVIVSSASNYADKADSAANHFLVPMGMGTGAGGTTLTTTFLPANDPTTADYVRVTLTRRFSFIPTGGGGGLPTEPGATGTRIPLPTSLNIVGEATMELQPAFQR